MKHCPKCGSRVDDLAIFCDNCDAVLDTNALLADEESPPQSSPIKNQPIKTASVKKAQVATKGPNIRSSPPVNYQKINEPAVRKESPPFVPKSVKGDPDQKDTAEARFRETFDEMVSVFKLMGMGQRAGVLSALAAFVFSFFPWVSVPQEGPVSGLDVGGFYLILIAGVYFTYLVLDFMNNEYISQFEQYRVLILITLGFLGILLCTYRIIFPYHIEQEATILKNIGLRLDIHRKMGLFLSAIASFGMFISPFLGGFVKKTER